MANAYIHLDSIETLSQYDSKMDDWKRRLYSLFDEMRNYHDSLEADQKWYGQSHQEFKENHIMHIYTKFFQPAAEFIDEESRRQLRNLKVKAEELGIR